MTTKKLEYVRGRTRVHWEISRRGTTVRTRAWRPRQKEIVREHRHATVANAKREVEELVAAQRERGFVEAGPNASKQREAYESVNGPKAVAAAEKAIRSVVVPQLREAGFRGSFPRLRRREDDRHSVVWFDWGRAGGHVSVGLAVVAPKKGASPIEDFRRAVNVRNRQRTTLSDLIAPAKAKRLFFDEARKKWGTRWPDELARLLAERLGAEGERWLGAAARRPKRSKAR